MAIYDIIPGGLNTAQSPLKLATGDCDVALNVDFNTQPGGFRKRMGSAEFADASAAIINAAVITMGDGDVYLIVKTAATGRASLKYWKLYPTADTSFSTIPTGATAALAGLTATDPGTFVAHNGAMYYFQEGGQLWWDGGATYNVGLTPPTGSWTATVAGEGQLLGYYLWAVSFFDEARGVESKITGPFPIASHDDRGLQAHPDLGAASTLAAIAGTSLSVTAGNKYTKACLWRTLGNQVRVAEYASRNISQLTPMFYRVTTAAYTGGTTLAFNDGFADGSLDRSEIAPVHDRYPPPQANGDYASFVAIHNGRGFYLYKDCGAIITSLPRQPEEVPVQRSWVTLWGNLWRAMTKGEENVQRADPFEGPMTALGEAGGQLLAFTRHGAYEIIGAEPAIARRLPGMIGCAGPNAAATGPGGRLWTASKQGLSVWPTGANITQHRIPELAGAVPGSMATAVVGYSQYDDAIMVAVPGTGSTKANNVYVFNQRAGQPSLWQFAWASATRGITKILSVDLPNAESYVLFCCDDGKIYKYPNLYQDVTTDYRARVRFYVGQEWAPRLKRLVNIQAAFGTITAPAEITTAGLRHPSNWPTQANTGAASTDSDSMKVILQGNRQGVIVGVDVDVPAADGACEFEGFYLQSEHEDAS